MLHILHIRKGVWGVEHQTVTALKENEMVDMVKRVSLVKPARKINYVKPAKVNMVKRINYMKAA